MAYVLEDLNDRVKLIKTDLQMSQQNQDEESVSYDSSQSDHSYEGDDSSSETESELSCESLWKLYEFPQQPSDYWKRSDEFCLCDRCFDSRKEELPLFNGNPNDGGFCDWIWCVDCYFQVYEIPEDKKIELVASRLEQTALSWWDQIQKLSGLIKRPIQEWTEMKTMLIVRFVSEDYDSVVDLPVTKKSNVGEFCKWIEDVEGFFKCQENQGDFSWCEQIQNLCRRLGKQPIQVYPEMNWAQMKAMLIAGFLSGDCDRGVYLPLLEKNLNLGELNEWMQDVESVFRVYKIAVDEQGEVVSNGIEKGGLAWWKRIQDLRWGIYMHQWEDVKKILIFRFLSRDDFQNID